MQDVGRGIAFVNLDQYNQYMAKPDWIDLEDAVAALGVRPQTLYAYVSRGRIQARPHEADPRRSLYRLADIEALKARKARGRRFADVAQGAISYGEPVLASAITVIADGRLFYRGQDAAILAETESLETVAARLWEAPWTPPPRSGPIPDAPDVKTRAFLALAERAGRDPPIYGRGPAALAREAAGLLDAVTDAAAGAAFDGPIAGRLAQAWGHAPDSEAADLIRRMLVLLADHELNASTFAARVAASTGASLSASVLAGLSALSGPRHGGAYTALAAFAVEAARTGPDAVVAARLAQGGSAPAFGHPLYPGIDPRAAAILARITVPDDLAALREAVKTATGQHPNVDFAIVCLARVLNLPADAPFALFAVGRCAGWITHAIEQNQTGGLIRPRAHYIGPPVG